MRKGDGPDAELCPNGRDHPRRIAVLRRIARVHLAIFKRFQVINADCIPASGPVILVSNHITAYDPVCLQVACTHRLIRFMQAREYYESMPMHILYKWLDVIPVNRNGNDTAGIRAALRTLSNGGCLGIYPEGKMSDDGELQDGHKGVALLALMSSAPVVPAYLHGTRPFRGMILDFLQFNRVTLYFGEPIRFDDRAGSHRDREVLDRALQRIMDGIVALRDRHATA